MTEKNVKNRDDRKGIKRIEKDIHNSHRMSWIYALIVLLVVAAIIAGTYWDWW